MISDIIRVEFCNSMDCDRNITKMNSFLRLKVATRAVNMVSFASEATSGREGCLFPTGWWRLMSVTEKMTSNEPLTQAYRPISKPLATTCH